MAVVRGEDGEEENYLMTDSNIVRRLEGNNGERVEL